MGFRWGIIFSQNNSAVSQGGVFIKNKLIIIIGSAVFLLTAAYIIYSLCTSGLFSSNAFPGAATSEIRLNSLGSAARLEGKVALVSIFANDKESAWDFSTEKDKKTREDMFSYTDIAVKWLCEQAKNYGKQLSFSYAADEQSDLYFETVFDDICMELDKSKKKSAPIEWEYIDKNIDGAAIKEKYGCDSIVYYIFLNQTDENTTVPFALSFYNRELDYPYEICFIPTVWGITSAAPSTIAHETLHTFGAPDLYGEDLYDMNYGTTYEYVRYCAENHANELMYTTYVFVDGEKKMVFDHIENELTDITAYYIGWLDDPPPEVDKYGLVHNQFENYTK